VLLEWAEVRIYLTAFAALSTDRPIGGMGGVFQIPFHCVMWYADRLGLDREQSWAFWEVIREMDVAFVTTQNEKAEAKRKASERQKPQRASVPRRTTEKR
jgi:hypothetical protein